MILIKRRGNNLLLIILVVFTGFVVSCEKDDLFIETIVTTAEIINIRELEAIGGGNIEQGGTPVSSRGICWSTEAMPTINNSRTINGSGAGSFSSSLKNLIPNTTYYVRAYASTKDSTTYGKSVSFTSKNSDIPILKTTSVSNLSYTSCISGGTVIYEGKGDVTSRGVCWSTKNPPSISDARTFDGTGIGVFTSNISGLDNDSVYYVRAYAVNSEGTAYGNLLYLKPLKLKVTDIDGNVYNMVTIGTQVWTVENLKVTKYQNGEPIQNILDNTLWNNTETGAYCNYNNDSNNSNTYGRLYNWFAADDARNIAPEGWHVAGYEDYLLLIEYLGGPWEAEEKMKNEGFKALAGGKRNRSGIFSEKGVFPYFWTSTEYHEGSTWARYLSLDGGALNVDCLHKNHGFSVRCVRN